MRSKIPKHGPTVTCLSKLKTSLFLSSANLCNCVNKECNHVKEVEPDKTEYCVVCGTKTIAPCLLLAGII